MSSPSIDKVAKIIVVLVIIVIVTVAGFIYFVSIPGRTSSTHSITTTPSTLTSYSSTVSTQEISPTTTNSSTAASSSTTSSASGSISGIGIITALPAGANYPLGSNYPTGPRFERFRVVQGDQWTSQYTANQILTMISQLKPNVLERMTTDVIDTTLQVPVCSGCVSMDYLQFLNNATAECSCYIIPRLNINTSFWESGDFLTTAREILQTAVNPRFTILSVDNWGTFCQDNTCSCSLDQQIFQPLYQMGWKGVGVLNAASPYYGTCGWSTYTAFDANGNTWTVNQNLLTSIQSDKTQQKILLYDPDFPGPAQKWLAQCDPSCDTPIEAIQEVISQQASQGYTYVYPIEQTFWDANQINTSSSGPFNGQSLYQIFENWTTVYD